jgi:hypothetical protein
MSKNSQSLLFVFMVACVVALVFQPPVEKLFAGNPEKDIEGTVEHFAKSKTIVVYPNDSVAAARDCENLGFKVIQRYKKYIVCELKPNTPFSAIVALVKCDSVKTVKANPR